jgi:hypothetical protein
MELIRIVTEHLEKLGLYPNADTENYEDGLIISVENNVLHISGNSYDLIELADYCVSLALSGENEGQHWHIDQPYMIDGKSEISEIVISLKKRRR